MTIAAATIAQVRSVPLLDIVRRDVKLQRHGVEWQGLCPFHQEKSPSFYVNAAKGLYHCFGCGAAGDIIDFTRLVYRLTFEEAVERLASEQGVSDLTASVAAPKLQAPDDGGKTRAALDIWSRCGSIANTMGAAYLRGRGITIPFPPTLRFNLLKHPTGLMLPAMVAAVSKAPDRRVIAVHRTYIKSDGSGKIPLNKPRLMLGPCGGGAVRLAPCKERLAVAEGIETALSVQQMTGWPTWAALSDGGIENLILPVEAQEILICADHDKNGVGQQAARRAAVKWQAEGRTVKVAMPTEPGTDFNDMLRAGMEFQP